MNEWKAVCGWYLLLMRGGVRRHIGGGGGILRGGDSLRGGRRTRWISTAAAVISCPSIWPVLRTIRVIQSESTQACTDEFCNKAAVRRTSVHVFESLLSFIGVLKLHISMAVIQVWVELINLHLNRFYFPISRKDLLDVLLLDKNKDSQEFCIKKNK